MTPSQKKLLNYTFWLLSRRRYTTSEIARKLRLKNQRLEAPADPSEINQVIEYLTEKKYLNDREYIELYLEGPAERKHLGIKKIIYALRQKGLPGQMIKTILSDKSYDELDQARALLAKKYPDYDKNRLDQKSKAKIVRQLTSKGFTAAIIYKLLR